MAPKSKRARHVHFERHGSSSDESEEDERSKNGAFEANPNCFVMKIPERKDALSKDFWWMVDTSREVAQGATPLVKRCMRNLKWSEKHTRRVLAAYEQFFELKRLMEDWEATVLSPCKAVDDMWHQHILDTKNYIYDCEMLCGHMVWHNPDGALDGRAKAKRDQTTRAALGNRFGSKYDEQLWLNRISEENSGNKNAASAVVPAVASSNDDEQQKRTRSAAAAAVAAAANVVANLSQDYQSHRNEVITLRVRDQSGEETFFKIRRCTKLYKLCESYAKLKGLECDSLRFTVNGERIDRIHTPKSMDLDDQDVIDCVAELRGCKT